MSAVVSKADMIRVIGDLASANSGDELATKVQAFGRRLAEGEFDVTNDIPQRVGLRQRFDELDALIDLSNPAVFAARRALGKAVGCSIEGSLVTAKTWPPYGENGALTEPPPARTANADARLVLEFATWFENADHINPPDTPARIVAAIRRLCADEVMTRGGPATGGTRP